MIINIDLFVFEAVKPGKSEEAESRNSWSAAGRRNPITRTKPALWRTPAFSRKQFVSLWLKFASWKRFFLLCSSSLSLSCGLSNTASINPRRRCGFSPTLTSTLSSLERLLFLITGNHLQFFASSLVLSKPNNFSVFLSLLQHTSLPSHSCCFTKHLRLNTFILWIKK